MGFPGVNRRKDDLDCVKKKKEKKNDRGKRLVYLKTKKGKGRKGVRLRDWGKKIV